MVNHYEIHVIFQDIEHQFQENVQIQKYLQSTKKHLLLNYINYLHPNIKDMTIFYSYHNFSYIYH